MMKRSSARSTKIMDDISQLMNGTGREEFSDESLFGEDRIEELIDKKNSFMRGGGLVDSFRSKAGKLGMRTNDDLHYSRQ